MTARPVKWEVSKTVYVEIDGDDICIRQGANQAIAFSATGTSVNEAIDALYAASQAMGYATPDSIFEAIEDAVTEAAP